MPNLLEVSYLLHVQSAKLTYKVISWLTRMSSPSDHANGLVRQPESNFEKDEVTSELPSSTIRPICLKERLLIVSKLGTSSAITHSVSKLTMQWLGRFVPHLVGLTLKLTF